MDATTSTTKESASPLILPCISGLFYLWYNWRMDKLTPEQEALAAELTHLQRMTVINYVGGAASQIAAYYDAGGKATNDDSARAIVSRMLAEANVKAFYESLVSSATNSAVMSRQEALERLSSFARTDLADLVEFGQYELGEDETGRPIVQAAWKIKDSVLQDPKKMASISELASSKEGIKIKTHSPLTAIQQLAKMQGWETAQKVDHTSSDGSMSPKSFSADEYAAAQAALKQTLPDLD